MGTPQPFASLRRDEREGCLWSRDLCCDAGEVRSGSLFHIALQSQKHPFILLAKRGDDEGLCRFEQAMDVKREIAVHACHLFYRSPTWASPLSHYASTYRRAVL
jgi:hypothetical protein